MLRSTDISPLARLVRRVDAAADGVPAIDAFATGFPSLDKALGGGVRLGDLIVIGGEVGAGKSALALAMALRMAQGGTATSFLTQEMTVDRVLERALAIEGRARVDEIRAGTLNDLTRAALGAAAIRLRDRGPAIELLPSDGPAAVVEQLRRALDMQVVFLDPLQGMARGVLAHEEELASAVRVLKAAAVELNIVIVLTAHLAPMDASRTDRRPVLEDFGALGAVAQHADIVLGLYREEMIAPGNGVAGATELLLRKNRNGNTGYVDLYFYKQWLRFEDLLDPDR